MWAIVMPIDVRQWPTTRKNYLYREVCRNLDGNSGASIADDDWPGLTCVCFRVPFSEVHGSRLYLESLVESKSLMTECRHSPQKLP